MRHANARLDLLRKGQRSKVIALSLYHQPNRLSRMNIQCALLSAITASPLLRLWAHFASLSANQTQALYVKAQAAIKFFYV